MASGTPFIERKELLSDINSFIRRNGGIFRQLSKRMSDLLEMSVYNDVVKFYKRKKCTIKIKKLKRDGTFNYKLSPSGLKENFSYFLITQDNPSCRLNPIEKVEAHHNIKIQSAHDEHIYYTADISICREGGAVTIKQRNGRKHSYILNDKLITFFEVKNLNPFPEAMFSFSGLVLEVMPQFIERKIPPDYFGGDHLTPSVVFSGLAGVHAQKIAASLNSRYNFNVMSGLYTNRRQIYSPSSFNTYCP